MPYRVDLSFIGRKLVQRLVVKKLKLIIQSIDCTPQRRDGTRMAPSRVFPRIVAKTYVGKLPRRSRATILFSRVKGTNFTTRPRSLASLAYLRECCSERKYSRRRNLFNQTRSRKYERSTILFLYVTIAHANEKPARYTSIFDVLRNCLNSISDG